MRVAIVHDWLTVHGGAEQVLESLLGLYPQADLYSLFDFIPEEHRAAAFKRPVVTSFLQRLPFAKTKYRHYLPLMPIAVEQFDLSGYDLVISSSHAVAKGVLTGPDQVHISYVHTPIRYAWDLQHQYLQEAGLARGIRSWLARQLLHYIRMWDARTANGVDAFVANSHFVARRVAKAYRRQAAVIYPPVNVAAFELCENKEPFYLTASRMVPYKKIDLIVDAFAAMPDRQLVVIGDGPDAVRIRAKAQGNITYLGYQPFAVLQDYMQRAQAFVFAAEEDFGILPVEAQACGTPVIAYGKGGCLETIKGLQAEVPTGVFFDQQTAAAIQAAVEIFEREGGCISPGACRENAFRFAADRFAREFSSFVKKQLAQPLGARSTALGNALD